MKEREKKEMSFLVFVECKYINLLLFNFSIEPSLGR